MAATVGARQDVPVDRRRLVRVAAFAALLAALVGAGAAALPTRHERAAPHLARATIRPRPPFRVARPLRPTREPVPILMYHVLATVHAGARFPSLFVSPAALGAQVDWLAAHGYHAVTLTRLFAGWRGTRPLPAKPIVLTFDDGYLSDYTVALPALRRHGWPGVLDLAVRNLSPGDIDRWQVRRLIDAGWELAAHTVSHVDLTTVGTAQLRQEVAGSRAALQRMFGVRVDFFCYPLGHFDGRVVAAVRAAGYLGATTEHPGLARPGGRYTLARIRVGPGDGAAGVAARLGRLGA